MSREITQDDAVRYLKGGAMGIGEDHRDPRPRAFAMALIATGVVRRLFLECNSNEQPGLNAAVSSKRDTTYEARISDLVTAKAPMILNPIELGEVAVFALKRLVPVHFIDLDIPSKGSHRSVVARDRHAASEFDRLTRRTSTTGCLVLFGGAHLEGGTGLYRGVPCLGELLDLRYVPFALPSPARPALVRVDASGR